MSSVRPRFRAFSVAAVTLVALTAACSKATPAQPAASEAPPVVRVAAPMVAGFDPLAFARSRGERLENLEAPVPPQCYTKTEGRHNPCWTCHAPRHDLNAQNDEGLQENYSFSEFGATNRWDNLFVDRSKAVAGIGDDAVLAYVREDNYAPLRAALASRSDFLGYKPDLDFARGFDERGFARDGSGWRAFRYKPFPGVFWPTNGSTDDVLVRLPASFRSKEGKPSLEVYAANLALLEASFASDPSVLAERVVWPTEPLDESAVGVDLDGDGQLERGTTRLVGLPARYFGDASRIGVRRSIHPQGTEFLHSVRYIDPDAPGMTARRMKELRYSRKRVEPETAEIFRAYEREKEEKEDAALPSFQGAADLGLHNEFGWMLQGYIEDAEGRLRLQTFEEHFACMGCHSSTGVTLDQTFALARKVPGKDGWRYQDLRGIPDVPQLGHSQPEVLTYFERTGAGDEFRANAEILERFFRNGKVDRAAVRRAAAGGDRDLTYLLFPSRERALHLNRAYLALVKEQRFEKGRDVFLSPPQNVHRRIENEETGLEPAGRVYRDGALRLDWSPVRALALVTKSK